MSRRPCTEHTPRRPDGSCQWCGALAGAPHVEPVTDVVFRRMRHGAREVIALFPGVAGTLDARTCQSYQHVGQHGAADLGISADSTLATPAEYAALKRELESIGYTLRVVKRGTAKHRRARVEQTR